MRLEDMIEWNADGNPSLPMEFIDKREVFYSRELSNLLSDGKNKLDVNVLSWAKSASGTHKGAKVAKIFDTFPDTDFYLMVSSGSLIDAADTLAAFHFPKKQPVQIKTGEQRNAVYLDPIHPDDPDGPTRITLGIKNRSFLSYDDKVRFFKYLAGITSKKPRRELRAAAEEIKKTIQYPVFMDYIRQSGLDPDKTIDITNVYDLDKDLEVYQFDPRFLGQFDAVFSPLGSGELFWDLHRSVSKVKGKKPWLVGVTTPGNFMNPYQFTSGEISYAPKLDNPFSVPLYKRLKKKTNKKTFFKVGSKEELSAAFSDFNATVTQVENHSIEAESTGASALAALVGNPTWEKKGLVIAGFDYKGYDPNLPWTRPMRDRNIHLKPGSKVLVISTGKNISPFSEQSLVYRLVEDLYIKRRAA
jgi:hypothetical protein